MRKAIFTLTIAALMAACGGDAPNKNTNTNSVNVNVASKNTNNPLAITTPTPAATTNNAPTLTPVYKAYCDAAVRKDEGALRRLFSADTIRSIEASLKADGEKNPTLLKYLEDEQVTNDLCEVRNEQISGNEALAEVRTKGAPNGLMLVFVKEGNDWKLTNRSPTLKK